MAQLASCAPLPEFQAEPEPGVNPAQRQSAAQETPRDFIRYLPKPVSGSSASEMSSSSVYISPLPEFSSAEDPLPSFDAPVVAGAARGQFLRTAIPENFRRPIRVGLSPRSQARISCPGDCRVVIDGIAAVRLGPQIWAEVRAGRFTLATPDGRKWIAAQIVRIEPWTELSAPVQIENRAYRGLIELYNMQTTLRVVNELPVEDYLRGVVPGEIGRLDTSMLDALKAQAVAARTYAYRHYGSRQSQGFDVYDDTRDQVYDGVSGEYGPADDAIMATRGVVMLFNGTLIDAYYHSTCGGHTESLETWNRSPLPYLSAVPDTDSTGNAWCALSTYHRWSYRYSWAELSRIAKANLSAAQPDSVFPFSTIQKIWIADRLPGNRVGTVIYVTDRGVFRVRGDKNRWLLRVPHSPDKTLPSAWFEIEQDTRGVTVNGRGFGHGIGLCQMGARAKAKAGWEYKQILWSYYPAVDLVKWVD